ncbi:VOC family protein, partial [Streptomyces sp. MS191]
MLVLDCAEPQALAHFYAELLGGEIQVGEDPTRNCSGARSRSART